MACERVCHPATDIEIRRKILELLRLHSAGDYRYASRLADLIKDDLAVRAAAVGQPDEPIEDEPFGPEMLIGKDSSLP